MTYLLIGEANLINKSINDIKKKENIDANSIIFYDLEEVSIALAIDDINTFNLFDTKKLVVVYNINKLDNEEILINYLKNQNDNILILVSYEKLDERKSIIKEIKKYVTVLECDKLDITEYMKEMLKGYKISYADLMLLKSYCNDDYNKAFNEIEKLKLYKYSEKEINSNDIKMIVKKSFDSSVFNLTDAIIKRDKRKALEVFYELVNNNVDELMIISVMANNYRLIYKIKVLCNENSDDEVIKILKIHPYRFKILKEQGYNYSSNDLLDILKNLSDMDIKIKRGLIDKRLALELFLTKI